MFQGHPGLGAQMSLWPLIASNSPSSSSEKAACRIQLLPAPVMMLAWSGATNTITLSSFLVYQMSCIKGLDSLYLWILLEKEMATHSSILAWRIPGTDEPSGLPSMGSHRIGHNWRDLAGAAAACLSVLLSVNWENYYPLWMCSVTQLCPNLCSSMESGLPGFSVQGVS